MRNLVSVTDMSDLQKVYRDTGVNVTLWGLGYDGGLSLTFTEQQLRDAGYKENLNIFDLQSIFQCNVTIEEVKLQSVHVAEQKKRFNKPLEES